MPDDSDIEIRPIATFEDFAASDTSGVVQELKERLEAQVAMGAIHRGQALCWVFRGV